MSETDDLTEAAEAEKLAALPTERYFRERAARAKPADFAAIIEKAGTDIAIEGDELPVPARG